MVIAMDESSLRVYFRRVLDVPAGASRKVLRSARDKRATRFRDKLIGAVGADREILERRLTITNLAYDCLSDAVRFKAYFTRLSAGEETLPDLDELLASLGEPSRPLPPRLLEKRQAALAERMQRAHAVIETAVREAAEAEAKRLQASGVPDADLFYESVYSAALKAGQDTLAEEAGAFAQSKLDFDDGCREELSALAVDTAEVAAHRAYDKLEDSVAAKVEPNLGNRGVALVLCIVLGFFIIGGAIYSVQRSPESYLAPSATQAPVVGITADEAKAAEEIVNPSLTISADRNIASGAGLIDVAGPAGIAGSATDLTKQGEVQYQAGVQAAMAGNNDKAIAEFEQSYSLSSSLVLALYNKAVIQTQTGAGTSAVFNYGQVLSHRPDLAQAYYNRAYSHQITASAMIKGFAPGLPVNSPEALAAARELQLAINNYNLCVKADSHCAQALYNRGLAYYRLGNLEQAYDDFVQAYGLMSLVDAADFNASVVAPALKKTYTRKAAGSPAAPVGPAGPPGPSPRLIY
jgi:tetratricopeptide (TPR) repeat protein